MKRLIFSCVAALTLWSCEMELDRNVPGAPVVVRFEKDYVSGDTKSSVFPNDVEEKESGGVVAFYDARTGRLDSQHKVEDFSSPMSLMIQKGRMNVYALGNMWLIDGDGNRHEPVFPLEEKDLEIMSYEFGEVSAGGGLRTESYDEIGVYGIPVRGVMRGVDVASGAVIGVCLERMFAKVRITVDHAGMSPVDGQFRNETLYFRQANGVQTPFAEGGSKAKEVSDLIVRSDYESPMCDGSRNSYTFYLPENRQKTPDPGLATYVEFAAEIDKSAGGYGGGVTYRFYLGKNSEKDNDLEGNYWYDILLTFKVGSLFEPSWRVNPDDDFSDDRLFCVMKDRACSSALGGQDVVVRAGRPGKVYVYMNRNGVVGENHLAGKPMTDNFVASTLDDCAWTGDFSELQRYGISASWESSEGRLSLEVTDRSRFVEGVRIPVTLRLLPGTRSVVMNVLTYQDQTLDFDCSEFYMGMMRTAALSGFVGGSHTVRVNSDSHLQHFRFTDDKSGSFLGKNGARFGGNQVNLYAWNYDESNPITLIFDSDDDFNDDPLSATFYLWMPNFRRETRGLELFLDGTGVPIDYGFNDRYGNVMDINAFSPKLYEKLLSPKLYWLEGYGDNFVSFGNKEFFIDHLGHYGQQDWIGNYMNKLIGVSQIDLSIVTVQPSSPLYVYSSVYVLSAGYPYYKRDFPQTLRTNYLNEYYDSEMNLSAEFNTFGNAVTFSGESWGGSIQLGLQKTNLGNNVSKVELLLGESVNLEEIPGGPTVLNARLTNPRVTSGDNEICWSSSVDIYHDMTVAPFGVFAANSPRMTVYLTYPKAAWMLKKYYESGTAAIPSWNRAGGMTRYDKYLAWTRRYTSGKNSQTTVSSAGDMITIMYADLFPSDYPMQINFTPAIAAAAASKTWLTSVTFKTNGNTLSQPLSSSYLDGNSYYKICTSSAPIGWVYSGR